MTYTTPLRLTLCSALLLGAFTSHAAAQQARLKEVRDVVYGQAGGRDLHVDLTYPAAASGLRPVVVYVHGGGWKTGSHHTARTRLLARAGYFCVSVEYRLSGEAIWPAQIHDCKAAIRWVRANAAKYRLDPERIGVWGHSAGGHLAAMLATSSGVSALEGRSGNPGHSSSVACALSAYGPADLLAMVRQPSRIDRRSPKSPEALLLGAPAHTVPQRALQASPITYVDAKDPPMLLQHGIEDGTVPVGQSDLFAQALRQAGVEVRYERLPGVDHAFRGATEEQLNAIEASTLKFFNKHLGQPAGCDGASPRPRRPRRPRRFRRTRRTAARVPALSLLACGGSGQAIPEAGLEEESPQAPTLTRRVESEVSQDFSELQLDLRSGSGTLRVKDEVGRYSAPLTLGRLELKELQSLLARLPAPGHLSAIYPTGARPTTLTHRPGEGAARSWTHTACPRDEAARRIERILLSAEQRWRVDTVLERPYGGRANRRLLSGRLFLLSAGKARLKLDAPSPLLSPPTVEILLSPAESSRYRELSGQRLRLEVATTARPRAFRLVELHVPADVLYEGLVATVSWKGSSPSVRLELQGRALRVTGVAPEVLRALAALEQRPPHVRVDGMVRARGEGVHFHSLAILVELPWEQEGLGQGRVLGLPKPSKALVLSASGQTGLVALEELALAAAEASSPAAPGSN